jgi:hypothetical protein
MISQNATSSGEIDHVEAAGDIIDIAAIGVTDPVIWMVKDAELLCHERAAEQQRSQNNDQR